MKEPTLTRQSRQSLELLQFVKQLRDAGNVVFQEYHLKVPGKRNPFRFDIAMPSCIISPRMHSKYIQSVAIEIEGIGHGHMGIAAFRSNISKYLEAFAQGWNVLRVTWREIGNGEAMGVLERAGIRVR